jgi:uncharacterized SAM-binding protein YcdF (DUF218 family)
MRSAFTDIDIKPNNDYTVLHIWEAIMNLGLAIVAKKWLGGLLMPLNVSLILLLVAFVFCLRRRAVAAVFPLGGAIVILLLTSNANWVNHQLQSLERLHERPTILANQFDFVVVLGGGHIADPLLTPMEQLSRASVARILKGVEVTKANPGARLIVSGYGGTEQLANAELMRRVAQEADIVPASLITVPKASNTEEEARLISAYIGDRPTALITSATHMDRALSHFKKFSNRITPVATDFQGKIPQKSLPSYEYLPDARYMARFDTVWHEKLGGLWLEILSWFS